MEDFYLLFGAVARWVSALRGQLFKAKKQGLSFERRFLCPSGTAAYLFMLFGPPARRAADGGLLGAAAPPRPPLHSPRTTPLGFPYSTNRQVSSALTSDNPVGLSSVHQPARAARLLLRELPSLRSGDLPARRAIPSAAFALHKSCGDVYLFERNATAATVCALPEK